MYVSVYNDRCSEIPLISEQVNGICHRLAFRILFSMGNWGVGHYKTLGCEQQGDIADTTHSIIHHQVL